MQASHFLALIAVLMTLVGAISANAQLRIEDRLKVGDISIKYNSNRWILMRGNTATMAQLKCRELYCGIDVGIEVEEKLNVCQAETVDKLLMRRLLLAATGQFSLYKPEYRKVQKYGKMAMHISKAYNRCHVQTDFVFACGEYRGKTYSMWLIPQDCTKYNSDQLMTRLLSGITAP